MYEWDIERSFCGYSYVGAFKAWIGKVLSEGFCIVKYNILYNILYYENSFEKSVHCPLISLQLFIFTDILEKLCSCQF